VLGRGRRCRSSILTKNGDPRDKIQNRTEARGSEIAGREPLEESIRREKGSRGGGER